MVNDRFMVKWWSSIERVVKMVKIGGFQRHLWPGTVHILIGLQCVCVWGGGGAKPRLGSP